MTIFDIGTSALLASQRALSTTANNIANASTPGYSRQIASFRERAPTQLAPGYLGNGVDATAVVRAFNTFVNDRVTSATAGVGQQSQLLDLGLQLDEVLASENTSLTGSLNRFFNAIGDFATDPTDSAIRDTVLTEAQTLEQSFSILSQRFSELRGTSDALIRNTIADINERTAALAAINVELQQSQGNISPSLLDQRDQQVRELAALIGVDARRTTTGEITVSTSGGQPLVLGAVSNQLSIGTNNGDPRSLSISVGRADGGSTDISSQLAGGSLVGLLEFRNRLLNTAEISLGRIAVATAENFNAIQSQGLNLNGELGSDLFRPLTETGGIAGVLTAAAGTTATAQLLSESGYPRVYSAASTTGTASVAITDASALVGSDYRVEVIDNAGTLNYQVTRLSDGADVTAADPALATLTQPGLELDISGAAAGDVFTIAVAPQPRQASEYTIRATDDGSGGVTYTVRRDADGVDVAATLALGDSADPGDPDLLIFEGIEVSIADASVGDRFTVAPYRTAAGLFGLVLDDPDDLAAAAPVRAFADDANAGTADIGQLQIGGSDGLPLGTAAAIELRFDADAGVFAVFSGGVDTGTTLAYDPAGDSGGKEFTVELAGVAPLTFTVSGAPQDGDRLRLEDGGLGDNSNARRFEALRFDEVVGGNASLFEGYGQLLADVGARVRQAQVGADAQAARLDAAVAKQQEVSGVNLEEEAADLLRLQQSFEAAARIIAVANQTFRSILDAVGA